MTTGDVLDPVSRLRALAAASRGAYFETTIPLPSDLVWSVLSDIETELPQLVRDLRSVRVLRREGERLLVRARGRTGIRDDFDARMGDGWWIMQGRRVVGSMAVSGTPDGGSTFAVFGTLRFPGGRLLLTLLRPLVAAGNRRVVRRLELRCASRGR